jgi:hypothetical protein
VFFETAGIGLGNERTTITTDEGGDLLAEVGAPIHWS